MLNSASHYLHFFYFFFSPRLHANWKVCRSTRGLCEGIVMSRNNEARCVLLNRGAWLDCQDFTGKGGKKGMNKKGETNRYWVRPSFAENMQRFHVMFCCLRFGSRSDYPWGPESLPLGAVWLGLALFPWREWWTSASPVERSRKLRWSRSGE